MFFFNTRFRSLIDVFRSNNHFYSFCKSENAKITDNDLVDLLQYYDLINELETVNLQYVSSNVVEEFLKLYLKYN